MDLTAERRRLPTQSHQRLPRRPRRARPPDGDCGALGGLGQRTSCHRSCREPFSGSESDALCGRLSRALSGARIELVDDILGDPFRIAPQTRSLPTARGAGSRSPATPRRSTRLPHRRRVLARPGRWPGWPRPSRHSRAAPDRAVLRSLSPWWQSSCRCLESSQTSARWLLCGAGTNTTGTCDSATTVEATPSSRPAFAGAPITSSAGRSQRKCGAAGPGRPRRGRGQRAAWRRACEARATGNP